MFHDRSQAPPEKPHDMNHKPNLEQIWFPLFMMYASFPT